MLMLIIVVGSAIIVYIDAKKIGVHRGLIDGFFDMSAGTWCACVLLLWIIGFPGYLFTRPALKKAAQQEAREKEAVTRGDAYGTTQQTAPMNAAANRRSENIKQCPFCAEDILEAAIKCKHCGSTLDNTMQPNPVHSAQQAARVRPPDVMIRLPFKILLGIIVVLLVASIIVSSILPDRPQHDQAAASKPTAASTLETSSSMPIAEGPTQKQFCEFVQRFRNQYHEAEERHANEAELSELRYSRKEAFPLIMGSGGITHWSGILKSVGTNSGGSASIRVILVCGNKSRSNDQIVAAVDDFVDDGVRLFNSEEIPRGTPLYSTIIGLKEGAQIIFSGSFVIKGANKGHDYVSELSLTEEGSMTNPDFDFTFDEMELQRSAAPRSTIGAEDSVRRDGADSTYPYGGNIPVADEENDQERELLEGRMTSCLQELPEPADGVERDVEKVLSKYIKQCGQEYVTFARRVYGTKQAAMNDATFTAYKAVGCKYKVTTHAVCPPGRMNERLTT
jgi:hypothetical protein